jgi:LacI family transcriptional regulator
VFPDYFKAGELATETMAKRGYTNFVSINYKFKAAKLFLKGVDSVLKVRKYSHKKHFLSREMEKNIQKWQAVHQDFASWVKEWDLPVAILSGISDLGPKISALCNANNIRIPEDVALLTSGNDLAYCEGISPTISSVDINFFEVGFQAARMLDFKIQNIPLENETTLVPSSGIAYRESTCHLVFADSIIRKAISFIADNYQKNIQIRDVVSNSQVSRRSLEQRFKDTVGHTIHEEIARLRLETMKLLLLQTRKSIKILSSEAGFSNVNHMRRAFLKATGVLPKEFRDADKLR